MHNPREVIFSLELIEGEHASPTNVKDIEHAIEESLREYAGMNTKATIERIDSFAPPTFKIHILEAVALTPCSFNQGVAILNDL